MTTATFYVVLGVVLGLPILMAWAETDPPWWPSRDTPRTEKDQA